MLATHGPASPSSAVILENWRRCADADAGRPSVQASARMLIVPDANMTTRGWRRAREGPEPAAVARWVPEEGAPFVQDRYKWGIRITIESAGGYVVGNGGTVWDAVGGGRFTVIGSRLSVHGYRFTSAGRNSSREKATASGSRSFPRPVGN